MNRCVIICASPKADTDFIKSEMKSTDFVICADNGYKYAKECGVKAHLIVGDFDSYKDVLPDDVEKEVLPTRKNDTDTFYCVSLAIKKGFKNILLLNALGGRFDHTLANISCLLYAVENGTTAAIKSENEEITVLKIGVYHRNKNGKTFSLLPFGSDNVTVSYSGTEYDGENIVITADSALGISNVFNAEESTIKIVSGVGVLIINNFV